jgi:hypothetical protein
MSPQGTLSSYTLITGPLPLSLQGESAISFISAYASRVDSMDLSGPYHNWYAPTCNFYNADGAIYKGGEAIWTWMQELFGRFEKVEHKQSKTWVLRDVSVGAEEKKGNLVMMDCVTTFWVKGELSGEGIEVPRLLSFVVGKAEGEMGTDGLQILEAKTWWDSGVLIKELGRRKGERGRK